MLSAKSRQLKTTQILLIFFFALLPIVLVLSPAEGNDSGFQVMPRTSSCPSVYVLGAAGSGEREAAKVTQDNGVGAEVELMWQRVHSDLANRGISSVLWADPYEADSTDVLQPSILEKVLLITGVSNFVETGEIGLALNNWEENHLNVYMSSIAQGASYFTNEVDLVTASCPASSIVAIGYSQGAMAIQQAELNLSSTLPGELNHITSTILLGDGFEVTNSKAIHLGSAPNSGEGVASWSYLTVTHQESKVRDVPRPASTVNVCNNDDIVCDFSSGTFGRLSASEIVHTTYSTRATGLLNQAADWAANQVKDLTPTTTTTVTPVAPTTTSTSTTTFPEEAPTGTNATSTTTTTVLAPTDLTLYSLAITSYDSTSNGTNVYELYDTLSGAGFQYGATCNLIGVNGAAGLTVEPSPVTSSSTDELQIEVAPSGLDSNGEFDLTCTNPSPSIGGNGESASLNDAIDLY